MIRATAVVLAILLVPVLAEAQQAAQDERTHTVQSGETLGSIARDHLGGAGEWRLIYEANQDRIADPDRISEGMVLVIPGADGAGAPSRVTAVQVGGPEAPAQDLDSFEARRALLDAERFEPTGAPEVPVSERTVFFDVPRTQDQPTTVMIQPPEMVPAVQPGVFQAAGWIIPIGEVDEPLGEILSPSVDQVTGPERSSLQLHEMVQVRFEAEGAAQVDDEFLVYRVGRELPEIGRVAVPTARIRIVQSGEGEAVAQIAQGYGRMEVGQRVTRLRPFPLEVGVHPAETGARIEGRLLAFQTARELYLPGDYAFVDIGAEAGLSVGDVLAGVAEDDVDWTGRELARFQVVGVQDDYATVRITRVKRPDAVQPGLRLALVRQMP